MEKEIELLKSLIETKLDYIEFLKEWYFDSSPPELSKIEEEIELLRNILNLVEKTI